MKTAFFVPCFGYCTSSFVILFFRIIVWVDWQNECHYEGAYIRTQFWVLGIDLNLDLAIWYRCTQSNCVWYWVYTCTRSSIPRKNWVRMNAKGCQKRRYLYLMINTFINCISMHNIFFSPYFNGLATELVVSES